MKNDKIELVSIKNEKKSFEYQVAVKLLTKYHTWKLPEGSKYKFVNNDIVKHKTDSGTDRKKTTPTGDLHGSVDGRKA